MSKIRVAGLAAVAMWLMADPAFAGCGTVASGKSDNPTAISCSANGSAMTQLASALPGETLQLPQGPVYPANNGNGHYICTPSGFGHIATCSLRGTN
jgi:hypothetical protein